MEANRSGEGERRCDRGWICLHYMTCMYKNRIRNLKIVKERSGEKDRREQYRGGIQSNYSKCI
jgi:hypothetical protein